MYDAAIVGSGIAGMTAAIVLAKHGFRTVVVEQGPKTGGLMQPFQRGNCWFPTGVHCLGSLAPGQILWRYFKYLGVLNRIRTVPMNQDNFLECRFPGSTFQLPYHHDAFRDKLLTLFPGERKTVEQYIADIRNTVARFSLYNLSAETERNPAEIQDSSLNDYLKGLTSSRELYAILTAINPFYAVPSDECPLYLHFLFMDSFLNSSWRIDEGYCSLAQAFEDSFKQAGGQVMCNSLVTRIECTGGEVKGIRTANGDFIEAPRIIFAGHPKQIPYLCADKALRPVFRQRLAEAEETLGVFGIAMSWADSQCPMAQTDIIVYDSWDTDEHYHQLLLSDKRLPRMLYFSGSPERTDGAYSVVGLSTMPFSEVVIWNDTKTGRRPESYNSAKCALAERTLDAAKQQWPSARTAATIKASFTPLTFRDYTLTAQGSAYGFKKSINAMYTARIGSNTRVKGLFIAGQSVVLPGLLGALISSVNVCCEIFGRELLVSDIVRETQ